MAGFEVRDVHTTDLISGRETLDDIRLIVFVGGFSNADTLGSAKGWAGAFLYNPKAKETLDRYYARKDTLSLGVCNGCQLMAEMGLITPAAREKSPKIKPNESGKFECNFVNVTIEGSNSVFLKSLQGSRLGIWVAHGEVLVAAGRRLRCGCQVFLRQVSGQSQRITRGCGSCHQCLWTPSGHDAAPGTFHLPVELGLLSCGKGFGCCFSVAQDVYRCPPFLYAISITLPSMVETTSLECPVGCA